MVTNWVDTAAYTGAAIIAIGTPFLLYWLHKHPRPVRVPAAPKPDDGALNDLMRGVGHLLSGAMTVAFYGGIIAAVIYGVTKVVQFSIAH